MMEGKIITAGGLQSIVWYRSMQGCQLGPQHALRLSLLDIMGEDVRC